MFCYSFTDSRTRDDSRDRRRSRDDRRRKPKPRNATFDMRTYKNFNHRKILTGYTFWELFIYQVRFMQRIG